MRKATAVDWAGDPIEVAGRFRAGHGETTYQEMLDHFRDYTDVVGDNPMNLGATTLAFTAYALTGEPKYRDWVLEYVDAWVERTEVNGGLLPTSVGPDGTIESGYGWYGGVYGWESQRHADPVARAGRPPQLRLQPRPLRLRQRAAAHRRPALRRPVAPDGRSGQCQCQAGGRPDAVPPHARPAGQARAAAAGWRHRRPAGAGPEGWYDFRPEKLRPERWSCTTGRSTAPRSTCCPRRRAGRGTSTGEDDAYPVEALQEDLAALRRKVQLMRADTRTPDTTMSDDPNRINPATTDALVQLMLGGLPVGRTGYPLHCRLRYFDPARRRAGLPEQVGALVERIAEDEVTVQLVNLDPVTARTVIVQGGAYAEHQITTVRQERRRRVDGGRIIRTSRSGSPRAPVHAW